MATLEEPRTTRLVYSPRFGGHLVIWNGCHHGGVHAKREDAEQHAAALEASEDWDHANWREMTGSAEFEP